MLLMGKEQMRLLLNRTHHIQPFSTSRLRPLLTGPCVAALRTGHESLISRSWMRADEGSRWKRNVSKSSRTRNRDYHQNQDCFEEIQLVMARVGEGMDIHPTPGKCPSPQGPYSVAQLIGMSGFFLGRIHCGSACRLCDGMLMEY
jgi:hypothetical protein